MSSKPVTSVTPLSGGSFRPGTPAQVGQHPDLLVGGQSWSPGQRRDLAALGCVPVNSLQCPQCVLSLWTTWDKTRDKRPNSCLRQAHIHMWLFQFKFKYLLSSLVVRSQ